MDISNSEYEKEIKKYTKLGGTIKTLSPELSGKIPGASALCCLIIAFLICIFIRLFRPIIHIRFGKITSSRIGEIVLFIESYFNEKVVDKKIENLDSELTTVLDHQSEVSAKKNEIDIKIPFFLSGGISLDNIDELNFLDNNLNLYGIDINSKFEEYPGYKDLKIIKKLFKKLEK